MSVRIVSQEQIRFDIDVESYNRIVRDVSAAVIVALNERVTMMLENGIGEAAVSRIVSDFDNMRVAREVAANIDYARIIDYGRGQMVSALLGDDRFNVLVNRSITSATVGIIDDTVERVTSRIQDSTNQQGDM